MRKEPDAARSAGWGLVGAILCIAVTLARLPGPLPPVLLALCFWACLLPILQDRAGPEEKRRGRLLLITLAPIYFATFLLRRDLVEMLDFVLNSDTERYIREALDLRISPRHLGFPVLTFLIGPLNAAGHRLGGIARLGTEIAYLESALIGALTVKALYSLLRRFHVPSAASMLAAAAFACSLTVWCFSSVIETYMLSTLLLLLLLPVLLAGIEEGKPRCWLNASLLTLLALLISLENLHFPLLVLCAFLLRRWLVGNVRLLHVGLFAAIVAGGFLLLLGVAAWRSGPGFYSTVGDHGFAAPATNLAENLHHFTKQYTDDPARFSPHAGAAVVARTFLLSVRAQPDLRPWDYGQSFSRSLLMRPGNFLYAVLLVFMLLPALWRGGGAVSRAESEPLALRALLLCILVSRLLFNVIFAAAQSVLFSPPSLACLWLLVGLGFRDGVPTERSSARGFRLAALAVTVALLLQANLLYLTQIEVRGW